MLRVNGASSGLSIVAAEIVLTHASAIGHSAPTGMLRSCARMLEPATGTWMPSALAAASRFVFIRQGELWRDQRQRNTNTNECSHDLHLRHNQPPLLWQESFSRLLLRESPTDVPENLLVES